MALVREHLKTNRSQRQKEPTDARTVGPITVTGNLTNYMEGFMQTNTKNSTTVLSRWTLFLGAMLTIALMMSSVAISQRSSEKTPRKTPKGVVLLPVDLGTAADFGILAKTGISTTGETRIGCDIGVSPIGYAGITGFALVPTVPNASTTFATSSLVTGNVYAANYSAPTPAKMVTAIGDMEDAYTDAAGRTPPLITGLGDGNITGLSPAPGIYKWTTGVLVNAPGGLTLSGSATDVWIFQIEQGLTVGDGAIVTLSGNAQACNIFWQVAGPVTIGPGARMKGNILGAATFPIVMQDGAKLDGRALSQNAVTLISDTITCCSGGVICAPPSCVITSIIPGPPKVIQITVQDLLSGLASVEVLTSTNANTVVPAFTVGTTSPLVITATKENQSLSSTVLLRVINLCGDTIVCDPVYTTISAEVPQEFALGANYPNPFNPSTRISFNISKPEGSVSLKVFDVVGREVKTLISEPMQPGQYFVEWDGTNNQGIAVTSGVYIYRMVAGEFVATRRMVLMK